MSEPAARHEERVLTSLMLAVLIVAALAFMREGPHYDNALAGGRFFVIAFFAGALSGFLGWVRASGVAPTLGFSAAQRAPWLASIALGLVFATAGSYVNRTYAMPTDRSIIAEFNSLTEAKNDRWQLMVKMPEGHFQRFLVTSEAAEALKNSKTVRLGIARGVLGADVIAKFEAMQK